MNLYKNQVLGPIRPIKYQLIEVENYRENKRN